MTAAQLKGLPQITTYGRVPAAQPDTHPTASTDGAVVHPRATTAIYQRPGGPAIGALPTEQVGGPTWLPVTARQPGWLSVLLPTKPNGRIGWLSTARAGDLSLARSPYRISIDRASFQLSLGKDGRQLGRWTVGIGSAANPTPSGRTFVLGSITDSQQDYSPVILPLGTHSASLDTFGGGPGTVGIHTWLNRQETNVYGTKSSDGCVRVPPAALDQIKRVPLGTIVAIR